MARDLSEVLHFFVPDPSPAEKSSGGSLASLESANRPALPVVAIPIGDHDVVRAAFAWNLTVEIARLGGRAVLVAPGFEDPSPLWPAPHAKPLGAEMIFSSGQNPQSLSRLIGQVAAERGQKARQGGLTVVRVPPTWLREPNEISPWLRWSLLFGTPEPEDLRETYAVSKLITQVCPEARVGLTVHGVDRRNQAEQAFARLSLARQKHLGRSLLSYGMLIDDLHVYRSIVAQKPIGLCHPQSLAARALGDVAGILLEDARKLAGV